MCFGVILESFAFALLSCFGGTLCAVSLEFSQFHSSIDTLAARP